MVRTSAAIALLASLWASALFVPALAREAEEAAEAAESPAGEPLAADLSALADLTADDAPPSLMERYEAARDGELDMDDDNEDTSDARSDVSNEDAASNEDKAEDMAVFRNEDDVMAQYVIEDHAAQGVDAAADKGAAVDQEREQADEAPMAAQSWRSTEVEEEQEEEKATVPEAAGAAAAGNLRGSVRDTPREHL
mmetsp:Transcript_63972/g.187675  ORF Transcript_63972/g.187675 Transcript_63972/m.187675 type:complete len:196 (+) Transcript_63972:79-666(+)